MLGASFLVCVWLTVFRQRHPRKNRRVLMWRTRVTREVFMASDLVSQISEALGPVVVSSISNGLGLDRSVVQNAVNAALPALLAALISLVSKSQGASKLNEVVGKQQPGAVSSLADIVSGPEQKAFIDRGSNTLTSLLGGTTVSALATAVGRYAGVGEGGSKSLLGLLGPAVLGVLAHEKREKGLDASGLARLLTSQKDNVVAALPSGFSNYLDGTGVLRDVIPAATRPTARPSYQSPPSKSLWPWLLGALAVLAAGLLAWNLLSGRHRQVVEAPSPKTEAPAEVSGEAPYVGLLNKLHGIKVGDVDIGDLSTAAVNDLYKSLSGIKDDATAQTAVPAVNKASSEFDQLSELFKQLPPDAQKAVVAAFAAIKPNLDQLIDRVLAIPGVGTIIKPTVDAIRAKLDVLTVT